MRFFVLFAFFGLIALTVAQRTPGHSNKAIKTRDIVSVDVGADAQSSDIGSGSGNTDSGDSGADSNGDSGSVTNSTSDRPGCIGGAVTGGDSRGGPRRGPQGVRNSGTEKATGGRVSRPLAAESKGKKAGGQRSKQQRALSSQ